MSEKGPKVGLCSLGSEVYNFVKDLCSQQGFHIVDPFSVATYNKLAKRHQVTTYGHADNLGVIIGTTKLFWDGFVNFVKTNPENGDPVDDYARSVIKGVMSTFQVKYPNIEFEIRMSSDMPITGRYIHIQTASHIAGGSHYDQSTWWSVHPTYGLWFVLRAALIFNLPIEGLPESTLQPLFSDKEKEAISTLTKKALDENWENVQTLLDIRSACSIGDDWRYTGLLLDYFYPVGTTRKEVLAKIREIPN